MRHFARFATFTITVYALQSLGDSFGWASSSNGLRGILVSASAGVVFSVIMFFLDDQKPASHKAPDL